MRGASQKGLINAFLYSYNQDMLIFLAVGVPHRSLELARRNFPEIEINQSRNKPP